MNKPIIHALDFDGVICDSAVETAVTGWKAAGQIWPDINGETPQALINRFRLVRPIIETGYEAILAMRLLFLGLSCDAIYKDFQSQTRLLMEQGRLSADDLKKLFGDTRDQWIAGDLASWLEMNPLFPGIAEKLQTLSKTHIWYVITTKQERFVKQIFKANAIDLSDDRIFGLDRNMTKPEVLKELIEKHPDHAVQFIEDRLPTLINVQKHGELARVGLSFALWGYNTDEDKFAAGRQDFTALSLEDFLS
ncbi:HAD family hydrolase [Methylomonas sp. MgM2]